MRCFRVLLVMGIYSVSGLACAETDAQVNTAFQDAAERLILAHKSYQELIADPDSAADLKAIERFLDRMETLHKEHKRRKEATILGDLDRTYSEMQSITSRITQRCAHEADAKAAVARTLAAYKTQKTKVAGSLLSKANLLLAEKADLIANDPQPVIAKGAAAPATTALPVAKEETAAPVSRGSGWDTQVFNSIELLSELQKTERILGLRRARLSELESELRLAEPVHRQAEAAEKAAWQRKEKTEGVDPGILEIEVIRAQLNRSIPDSRFQALEQRVRNMKSSIPDAQREIDRLKEKVLVEQKSNKAFQDIYAIVNKTALAPSTPAVLSEWETKQIVLRQGEMKTRCQKIQTLEAEIAWLKSERPRLNQQAAEKEASKKELGSRYDSAGKRYIIETNKPVIDEKMQKFLHSNREELMWAEREAETAYRRHADLAQRATDEIQTREDALLLLFAERDYVLLVEPSLKAIVDANSQKLPPRQPEHFILVRSDEKPKAKPVTPANENAPKPGTKWVVLNDGTKIEAVKIVELGDNYGVKTNKELKVIPKDSVKEIIDGK